METTQKGTTPPGKATYDLQGAAQQKITVNIPQGTDLDGIPDPIAALVASLKLDIYAELPPPPVVIKINDGTYGTLGNFSLAVGKAKSKKTFLAIQIAAAAIANMQQGTITAELPPHKRRVIYIDTEQSKFHALKCASRIRRLSGIDRPANFDVYYLRDTPYKTRIEAIEHIIQKTPDAGLVIIDGIKDIVADINSGQEATETADWLLKLTTQHNCHIMVLLHQNKTDINARGHLGTELINKAETTLSITRESDNKEISRVEAEYTRDKEFSPFAFMINDTGLPEIVAGWKKKDENKRRTEKTSPGELDNYKHFQILQFIQNKVAGRQPKHSEIMQQIKLGFQDATGRTIGDSKVREYITFYQNEGGIIRHGKERSPNSFYTIDPLKIQDV